MEESEKRVRRKLKKDVSEANSVAVVVEKAALSHPEVSFKFIRDGQVKLHTPGDGKLLSAIHAVLGREAAASMIPVNYEAFGMKVSGYTCKPVDSRSNRTMQNFFINGRFVRSKTMMAALESSSGMQEGLAMFIYASILAPISEEILFRGLIQHSLLPFGKKFAVFGSALLFGIFHGNLAQTPFAFLAGLCYNGTWIIVGAWAPFE